MARETETDLNAGIDTKNRETDVDVRISAGGEPVLGSRDTRVAEVVHACHSVSIDQGLETLAIPGLTRLTLEPVLQYCASF